MPQVQIPQALFDQVEKVARTSGSAADFVVQAVREKLAWETRKGEFYRLSEETRAAMTSRGLTEADILADFEASRAASNGFDRG